LADNVGDLRILLDDEYAEMQAAISALRCELFSTADDLEDVRALQTPPTALIEQCGKRPKTQAFVIRSMARAPRAPAVAKLTDSVRLNRLWE
jgi:hypothetical protein